LEWSPLTNSWTSYHLPARTRNRLIEERAQGAARGESFLHLALAPSRRRLNATTKFYPNLPHGMPTTHADQINADLLGFIKGEQAATVGQ